MPNCTHCGKPLRAIGDKRKNGKSTTKDWDNRQLHVGCWKYLESLKPAYVPTQAQIAKMVAEMIATPTEVPTSTIDPRFLP